MTMGEGGPLYTDNPLLNKIIRSFRDWGRTESRPSDMTTSADTALTDSMVSFPLGYDHKYVYSHFGYNLKATDPSRQPSDAQLEKFPDLRGAQTPQL